MARRAPHAAEVAGGVAEAAAKMPLPDPIGDAPPGERVVLVNEPVGECRPPGRFRSAGGKLEPGGESGDRRQGAGADEVLRLIEVATLEDADLTRRRVNDRAALVHGSRGGGVELVGGGEFFELGLGETCEDRGVDRCLLCLGAGGGGDGEGFLGGRGEGDGGVGVAGGDRKPATAEGMHVAMCLPEDDGEGVAGAEHDRRRRHEDGVMRLSFLGMDPPGGRRIAIEGMLDRPALLVEVGGGAGDRDPLGLGDAGMENAKLELREMEIAVLPPPRPLLGERFVGDDIEADRGDRGLGTGGGERDDVAFGRRAAREDRAVVEPLELGAESRRERGQGERRPQGPRLARGFPGGDRRHVLRVVEEGFGGGGSLGGHALPALAGGGDEAVGIPVDLPLPDPGKDGLEGVVVFLRDRVEFVGVAAGTVGRRACQARHHLRDHVVAVEILKRSRRGGGGGVVVGAGAEVAESGKRGGIVREKDVGGELGADEGRPGEVVVEGLDDPIAVGPGVGPEDVVLEAMAVGKMDRVEPVPGHPLAEARRGEEPVDQSLVGVGCGVGAESRHLLRRRREAVEIDRDPADEGPFVGLRQRHEPFLCQPLIEEGIDRVFRIGAGAPGQWRGDEGAERPPVAGSGGRGRLGNARIDGALAHPGLEDRDLLFRKLVVGHLQIGIDMPHRPDEEALVGGAGENRRPAVAAGRPTALPVEGEVSLHLAGGMGVAGQAAAGEDRLDLVAERRCRVPCPVGPGGAGDEEQGEGDSRGQRGESSHDRFPGGREDTTVDRRPDAGRPSPADSTSAPVSPCRSGGVAHQLNTPERVESG